MAALEAGTSKELSFELHPVKILGVIYYHVDGIQSSAETVDTSCLGWY